MEIEKDKEKTIINDKSQINNLIYLKYIKLFNDNNIKNKYNSGNEKFIFNEEVKIEEIKKLKIDKGISWDYIPTYAIVKNINKDDDNNRKTSSSIKELFDNIMNSDAPIPEQFNTCRLVCLNKNGEEACNLNSIRQITVYGPLFKLMEKCIFGKLNKQVVPILAKAQTGFIEYIGIEINLLKLREESFNLKKKGVNDIYILFYRFKMGLR